MSQQQREQVDSLLEQLEAAGNQQQPRPLDNPRLWGNYNVAYTSTSRAQSERGQREHPLSGSMLPVVDLHRRSHPASVTYTAAARH